MLSPEQSAKRPASTVCHVSAVDCHHVTEAIRFPRMAAWLQEQLSKSVRFGWKRTFS